MKFPQAAAAAGVLLVVALLGMVSVEALKADPRELYELLCQDAQEVDLHRISDVQRIIEFVKTSDETKQVGCDPKVRRAILEMEEPLREDERDNHCTADRVNRIVAYVATHIRAQDPTEEVPQPVAPKHLPQALKRFFIGYALVVSKVCKLGMLKLLIEDSKPIVDRDDYKEVLRWTEGDDINTASFLHKATNYDDMFLVGNAICDSASHDCRKLFVQSEHWEKLREMRITCHKVFRPFYSTLIQPFVRLAHFGIDYMDGDLHDRLDDFRENPHLQKWYKIVFLCESLLNVVPLPIPKEEKQPEFHIDEEALKELDQEELEDEIEGEQEAESAEEHEEEVVVIELDESCDWPATDNTKELEAKKQELAKEDELIELDCRDGKKVIKVTKKPKRKGNFLTRFGKDIVKEMRKLQRERKAYLLSRKTMPVTNIMLKKDVEKYETKYGPINVNDFGEKAPIDYQPKPMIRISDDVIPPTDKRIIKAIKQYEAKKRNWTKVLKRLTKRYVRLFKRIFFIGRVKFGGKSKMMLDTDELMFKVFDKAMWKSDNQELVGTPYGKWRKFLEFQNISNVATCVSMTAGIVFFILQTAGVCG